MKYLIFLLFALISIAITTSVATENKTASKAQTQAHSNTIIQIGSQTFNKKSLFSSSQSLPSLKNNKKKGKSKKNKKNKKKKTKVIKIKRKKFSDPIKVLMNGWLKVSTPMFRHTGKFPPIILPDGREIKIQINRQYFRINQAFNPGNLSKNLPSGKKYFWFRLSGKNLYYSMTRDDINVLGAISVRNIVDSYPNKQIVSEKHCFRILDREQKTWTLCAQTHELRNKWICKIKTMLGLPDKTCLKKTLDDQKPTVITKKIKQPFVLIPLPSPKCNENWDYLAKGGDWNCECSEGKEQSPINLPPKQHAIDSPIKPVFQYDEIHPDGSSSDISEDKTKPLKIKYEDNALRIKHKIFGKLVTLDGAVYFAEEIIFHTPAQHTINGKVYPMEMEIIHYGKSKGDIAKQVVLSFIFKSKPGIYNKFIDDVDFFNLPSPVHKSKLVSSSLYIPKILFNTLDQDSAFMKPFSFYTYQGSLTAPPCTQRTIHYVAAKPIPLGTTAIQLFEEAIRMPDLIDTKGNVIISKVLPQNNRSIQPLNGRAVFYYDHVKYCGPDPVKERVKPKGHYEKKVNKVIDYFYVNGVNPSGLPGAFVVSEKEALGNKPNYY